MSNLSEIGMDAFRKSVRPQAGDAITNTAIHTALTIQQPTPSSIPSSHSTKQCLSVRASATPMAHAPSRVMNVNPYQLRRNARLFEAIQSHAQTGPAGLEPATA